MPTSRIFVSHSSRDNDWCRCFVSTLQGIGYSVWFDEKGLYTGEQWIAKIEQELQSRDTFLIIVTPNSWASEWVQKELRLAMSQRKRIVAVFYKSTNVDGFIRTYQRIDVLGQDCTVAAHAVSDALEAPSDRQDFAGRLVVVKPGSTGLVPGSQVEIKFPMTLGSSWDNSLVLRSSLVSPYHARIYYDNHGLWVEDLNSSRGTTVDGY